MTFHRIRIVKVTEKFGKFNGWKRAWETSACTICAWEDAGEGVSREAFFLVMCKVSASIVVVSGGGDDRFFAAIELIDHLLSSLLSLRKSMFRKSMGSGDNGKPHQAKDQERTWERTVEGSRRRPYITYRSPSSPSAAKWTWGRELALRRRTGTTAIKLHTALSHKDLTM